MCNIHDIIIIMTMMTPNYINRRYASIRRLCWMSWKNFSSSKNIFLKNITKRPTKIMNLFERPEQISFFHKYKTGALKLMMTIFIAEWKKGLKKKIFLLYLFCIFKCRGFLAHFNFFPYLSWKIQTDENIILCRGL